MMKKFLFPSGLALLICLFLFAGGVSAQTKTIRIEYGGENSWTVPTTLDGNPITVTSVTFEAWGGGGAGGFCNGGHLYTAMVVSGAGGGGAYGKKVISDPTPGEVFALSVGAGGYNTAEDNSTFLHPWSEYKNRTEANGMPTTVTRNSTSTVILEAMGGYTCTGINNLVGANGGANTGAGDLHYAGGKGGNAAYDCPESIWPYAQLAGRRSSGGGGGAGGPAGPGNPGGDAICDANNGWGASGTSSGAGGIGGRGTSDHNDVLGGKPVGAPGNTFGGGGGGTKAAASWHSGGAGANGGILITYSYTTTVVPTITVGNAQTAICSGAQYDVILDVDLLNVDPATVELVPNSVSVMGLVFASPTLSYEGGEFHLRGTATNSTTGTLTANMADCYLRSGSTTSNTFTFALTVYAPLDGGIIAKDQFVCQDQTLLELKGDGTVVGATTTAPATGGSGVGGYQWMMKDMVGGGVFENISGATSTNLTPVEGYAQYMRTYTDDVCGTTVVAEDGNGYDFLFVITVSQLNPGTLSGTDNVCTNEAFSKTLQISEFTSPATSSSTKWNVYWQISTDNGATWTTLASSSNLTAGAVLAFTYDINYSTGELSTPGEIQYRYGLQAVKGSVTCDMVPCNGVYKLIVGSNATDYTGQFPDREITMYYGECETDISTLTPPTLTPTPVSITRGADGYTTVAPGEYNIIWIVSSGTCGAPVEYTQKVKVKFPECGTVTDPKTFTDAQGLEYRTIRVGCECWFAENLRTNAGTASYYNDDPANEGFGKLYSWADAMGDNTPATTMTGATYIQGVCPTGWSIPTPDQYSALMAVGMDALKSNEEGAWLPGMGGSNTSGFNLKGAGLYEAGQYQKLRGYGDFWTTGTNPSNSSVATAVEFRYNCDDMVTVEMSKENKLSVRCVRVSPN